VVDTSAVSVLDVCATALAQRHGTIFNSYEALEPGAVFLLIKDYDPKPLRYRFELEHGGTFTWDYVESGPKVWRAPIGRITTVESEASVPGHHA
jgi:uncharacterized protein (DUF2249 family)